MNSIFGDRPIGVDVETGEQVIGNPYSHPSFCTWIDRESNPKSTGGVYSDRMVGWDRDKYNHCCQEIWGNKGHYFYLSERCPEQIEKFLSKYFDRPIKLTKIMQCVNHSSGYPLWFFAYHEIETKEKQEKKYESPNQRPRGRRACYPDATRFRRHR